MNSPTVALTDAKVIDGTGRPAQLHQTVLLQNGRIVQVGAMKKVKVPVLVLPFGGPRSKLLRESGASRGSGTATGCSRLTWLGSASTSTGPRACAAAPDGHSITPAAQATRAAAKPFAVMFPDPPPPNSRIVFRAVSGRFQLAGGRITSASRRPSRGSARSTSRRSPRAWRPSPRSPPSRLLRP